MVDLFAIYGINPKLRGVVTLALPLFGKEGPTWQALVPEFRDR